jgi:hypothetical protein
MLDFELPVVEERTPLTDAFGALLRRDVSGVVVRRAGEYRLLHLDDLRRALDQGKKVAGEIESFTPLGAVADSDARALEAAFDDTGCRYLLLDTVAGLARLISRHEPLAHVYLSTPQVVRCTNPNVQLRHRYPPNIRAAGQTTCTFDSYPLV